MKGTKQVKSKTDMSPKTKRVLEVLILIIIITLIVIAVKRMLPETEATSSSETITVSYSSGEMTYAFETVTGTLTSNAVSGYVTFPDSFIGTVGSIDSNTYDQKVDDETYYFNDNVYETATTGTEDDNNSIAAIASEKATSTEEPASTGTEETGGEEEETNTVSQETENTTVEETNTSTDTNTTSTETNETTENTTVVTTTVEEEDDENTVDSENTVSYDNEISTMAIEEEEEDEPEEETAYSYTFVGWKIKNTDTVTPTETVFQPGDYIDIDTLKAYAVDGVVELEALWAKVIYAQNPYSTMYYTDYWIYDKDYTQANYTATGAWNYTYDATDGLTLNLGNDVDNPVSSLDYAYYLIYQLENANSYANNTTKNAYAYVIMLTGDLDYCKSSTNGASQDNFFKGYDVYDGTYDSTKNYIFGDYVAQQTYWGYFGWYNGSGTIMTATSYGVLTSANERATSYAQSVTFKSVGDNTYNLNINGYGYYDYTYGSIRIDNVKFAQTSSTTQRPNSSTPVNIGSETYFKGTAGNYIEFTVRSSSDKFTFRTGEVQTVVLNGGTMTTWETSYTTGQNISDYDIHWYLGGSGYIANYVTLGVTCTYESNTSAMNCNFVFTMSGGYTGKIRGASAGLYSTSSGTRTINIIGDGTSNDTTSPKVTDVYGGAYQGTFTGTTYVNLKGTTRVTNVYGGGCDFTATTYGNTNVNIENCTISGNVFAGGYNGNVETDNGSGGNATLNISNSTISGNVYGSGMGGTQTVTTKISVSASQSATNWQAGDNYYVPDASVWNSVKNSANGDYDADDWTWTNPASCFPYVQDETEYICVAIYKAITWTSNSPDNLTYERWYLYAYLSLATVANDVTISIDGSNIGGNVYGGGSVAVVGGNTDISITGGSVIGGSVYGGGDGATQPSTVTVYTPISSSGYTGPTYSMTWTNGNLTKVTYTSENPTYTTYKYSKKFTWSNDTSLLDTNGIDADNYLIYSPNVDGLGLVEGSTNVTVSNSTVTGNIVAGGNASDVNGNTTLNVTNTTCSNVYGGGYSGDVEGDATLSINNAIATLICGGGYSGDVTGSTAVTVNGATVSDIYAGGYSGAVGGNTTLTVETATVSENIYGGGYSGDVTGSSTVTINGGTATEVFGGGYSGNIGTNATVVITDGTFTNVFGGSDQAVVSGNTYITIGDPNDLSNTGNTITVSGVVYGGGRGKGYSDSGDASSVTTVEGSSEVTIQGINTSVENYGSVKFGAIAGDANITFNYYWSGNATAKYKTMNGIDRATTVTFTNSYVLLENDDGTGNLVGIQSIENLVIPSGSGLKISADGEITGDFTGGGELYLDSLVCLTVDGDISGDTTLVLNPKITEENLNQIAGGLESPYLIVKGSTNGDVTDGTKASRLVSGESRYEILCTNSSETDNYSYYYIKETITIVNGVSVTSTDAVDRVYGGSITASSGTVYILDNGAFTSDVGIEYALAEVKDVTGAFENLTREFTINIDKEDFLSIPVGTEICMIVDEEYYFYTTTAVTTAIPLTDFKDADGDSYEELEDVVTESASNSNITVETNGTTLLNTYYFSEDYRFIVNFSNTSETVSTGTYYTAINVYDDGTWFEDEQVNTAVNTLTIQNRSYDYEAELSNSGFRADGVVNILGTLNIDKVADDTYLSSNELNTVLSLYDSSGTKVSIPVGTVITVGSVGYTVTEETLEASLLSALTTSAYSGDLSISLDFSNVLPDNLLASDTYTLEISYVFAGNTVDQSQVTIPILNINGLSYGLTASLVNDSSIDSDKQQLVALGEGTEKEVAISYTGESSLSDSYIAVSVQKQTSKLTFEDFSSSDLTVSTSLYENVGTNLSEKLTVTFGSSLEAGTYRVLVTLCDEYGYKLTEDYVNFIVY